jgi:hypothetical protein
LSQPNSTSTQLNLSLTHHHPPPPQTFKALPGTYKDNLKKRKPT